MSFDPNYYAYLQSTDADAAQQYIANAAIMAAATGSAAALGVTAPPAPAAVPQATFQQPNLQQGFQQQAAAPQQVAARGTLEDFFNQPSGGGGPSVTSKFFNKRPQGSWLQLTVLADVTNADVQHQKTPQGILQYFKKNGQDDLTRPKLVLVVKVQVTGSSDGSHVTEFPDGQASLWLKKGPVTDDLIRAMTAAGDPSGYPKAGAQMVMQSSGELASRTVGFSATKLYTFQYAAPAGSVDLQAIAQAASGFPTSPVPATTAAPVPAAAILPTPPVAAVPATTPVTPSPAPSLTTPTAPAAAPTEVPVPPVPVVDDPKAAERAELLLKLQGLNA